MYKMDTAVVSFIMFSEWFSSLAYQTCGLAWQEVMLQNSAYVAQLYERCIRVSKYILLYMFMYILCHVNDD